MARDRQAGVINPQAAPQIAGPSQS
jgi:hypothetical protein